MNQIDVTHQVSAVERAVGTKVLEAGEARVVSLGRSYRAAPEEVWDALTDASRIPRWFMPVSGELRLGGRYQLEGNAGGTVTACDPPRSFAATWEYGGEVSWIEVRLDAEGDGTRFTLDHIAHVDDQRWAEFGPGAVGIGWDLAVMGLTEHLSGAPAVVPSEAEAWMGSEEGKRYVTEAGERWREASVAAGTDPEEAAAAQARVTAFYTGG